MIIAFYFIVVFVRSDSQKRTIAKNCVFITRLITAVTALLSPQGAHRKSGEGLFMKSIDNALHDSFLALLPQSFKNQDISPYTGCLKKTVGPLIKY